jgi:hypothetical protein
VRPRDAIAVVHRLLARPPAEADARTGTETVSNPH